MSWNKLKQVETSWNKLKQVEASWSKLKQVDTSWSKLKQVEASWNKLTYFDDDIIDSFNVGLQGEVTAKASFADSHRPRHAYGWFRNGFWKVKIIIIQLNLLNVITDNVISWFTWSIWQNSNQITLYTVINCMKRDGYCSHLVNVITFNLSHSNTSHLILTH